jgi:hypothetical protein
VPGFLFKAFVIAVAVLSAVLPFPARWVERYYSNGVYPALQRVLTTAGNQTAVAVFDVALGLTVVALLALLVRRRRVMNVLTLLACVWLAFLLVWGLNYRRVPLADRLAAAQEPPSRSERAEMLLVTAVEELNALAPVAHQEPWPPFEELARRLTPAFSRVQAELGLPGRAVPARPKHSGLSPFFRLAAIDGFTDPFFLETIVNPAVLPVERAHVLAHEWAHLAGLAEESEASFFGWLACLRGGAQERYSGWLGLYPRLAAAVPQARSREIQGRLAARPRQDLAEITDRMRQASPTVRRATEATYDRYLRANRVDLGIASYDAVINLLVSTEFTAEFVPRLRP